MTKLSLGMQGLKAQPIVRRNPPHLHRHVVVGPNAFPGNACTACNVSCAPRPVEISKIGDRMPDGTVYAGVSPDSENAMYAMPSGSDCNSSVLFERALRIQDCATWPSTLQIRNR